MEVIHPRVAGIDVHKKIVWVAVRLPGERPGERTVTAKRFKTFWRSLRQLAAWLAELGVTDAAMESTGVYWWPVYHALAQAGIEVCVCNAAHMRNVPGRKRDIADCQWIAELHEHGLLRPSFIPAAEVAALRARTRYRKKLIEQRTSEGQRLAKVLEDARHQDRLGGLPAAGRLGPGDDRGADRRGAQPRTAGRPGAGAAAPQGRGAAAGLRRPVHRRPRPEVPAAPGRLRPPHRQDHRAGCPGRRGGRAVRRADRPAGNHPGDRAAHRRGDRGRNRRGHGPLRHRRPAGRLGRTGTRRQRIGGKRKHAAARKGNRHLRVAMVEAAWATARTRTRPEARFRRLARRFGKGNEKKAAVAVAHTLICIAWAVLSRGEDYAEAGEDYYEQRDRRDREHLIRHHQQALARLGYQVTLIPPGDGSPPPTATSQQPAA